MTHEITLDSEEIALVIGILSLHGIVNGSPSNLPLPSGFDHYDVENLKATLEGQINVDELDREDEARRDDEHDQFRSAGWGTDEDYGGGDDERY
jgi:hypothetical protein